MLRPATEGLAVASKTSTPASSSALDQPIGPACRWPTFIGLDTCLYIADVLHRELGEDKYRPAALLRTYVAAGWLGRKSGRGFYQYQGCNALDVATLTEIGQALELARAQPGEVRAVLLTGAGEKAFIAGAEIADMFVLRRPPGPPVLGGGAPGPGAAGGPSPSRPSRP